MQTLTKIRKWKKGHNLNKMQYRVMMLVIMTRNDDGGDGDGDADAGVSRIARHILRMIELKTNNQPDTVYLNIL